MLNGQITHSYVGNTCTVIIPHPHAKEKAKSTPKPAHDDEVATGAALHVNLERIRNVDVFISEHDLYFYADVKLYKFHSRRTFDLRGLKALSIKFDTSENCYQLSLRCLPPVINPSSGSSHAAGNGGVVPKPKTARKEVIAAFLNLPSLADTLHDKEPVVHEWKLKRITDQCQLQLDAQETTYKLTSKFGFGYASKYRGAMQADEVFKSMCRVSDPQRISPVQRRLDRVTDELKRFSREQYKMNFVELQVPAGHQNPLRYKPKVNEASMTQEQAHLLHNISNPNLSGSSDATALAQATLQSQSQSQSQCQSSQVDRYVQNEIDCGLISIVLSICYDVRTTNNEPTCESGWTRSMLCPMFCYFEQFDNCRDVLVAFLRRVITYPLYRNFELGRQCVRDAIEVLKSNRIWLISQLLLTHQQFSSCEPSRDCFNRYYLEDYIRYLSNANVCTDEHMRLLARNVKNVLMDVGKRHLDMGVIEIETELIKELMQEMRIDAGSGSESPTQQHSHQGDDDMDIDNDTSGQEDETTTDDDSVITDSFDSMDLRLIENDVYAVDEEDEADVDDADADADDDEEQSEVDDDDDDDDEDSNSTTSASEAEGNSVIEQCTSNSEAAVSASASASTSTK
ncbi:CG10055 [Drosophila busckii]|uniref:Protein SHQ1 homolog n=1 Tax=Drosophila busckii TaxID=30019 RepID=A0A0M4EH01_DROBS|nr:CG10055 [Drosophila busckii]